jgi:hypothetical protein
MRRPIYWLYVVGIAFFVSGIGFLVTSARARESAHVEVPITTPVATVKQIMQGIVDPATNVVFGAVSSTSTKAGVVETAPKTDREWELVGNSAAALIESGNLMMMGNRAVDAGDWVKMSRALTDAAVVALEAVQAKDKDALLASGDAINTSCDNCHLKYQRQ